MKKIIALAAILISAQASAWWGNDSSYNNGYGNAYGNGYGYSDGSGYGAGNGDASGDFDGSFSMSFSGRARGNAKSDWDANTRNYYTGYGNSNFDGRSYTGYAPYYYGYPVAMAPTPAQPAAPKAAPADDDKDGVVNISDLCPDTVAGTKVDALGCGEAERIVLRGVNFKTNSDELTEDSLAILDNVSNTLSANPQVNVAVEGHTDSDGDNAYNKDLSQRRAQSVVKYLVSKNVDANNLKANGFGEEQPVASNDTAEGKAQNRRVELNRL